MSILASLAFVLAAVVVIAALRSTFTQFADAALGNLAALDACEESREFRARAVTVIGRPVAASEVRRVAVRGSARQLKRPERMRAAA